MLASAWRSLFFSLCVSLSLYAQNVPDPALQELAAIEDDTKRNEALQSRISVIESLEGRLLLLREAEGIPELQKGAARMRFDLLLLSGRTEEAGKLLQNGSVEDPGMARRLALVHGETPFPESSTATEPGLNKSSIGKLSESDSQTPESFAVRRGMLISTGLLFSPYEELQTAEPATKSAVETGDTRIQVGAFSSLKNARDHIQFLEQRGVNGATIIPAESGGRRIYKTVIAGIVATEAQRELVRLKEKGIEGFILN